MSQKGYDDNGRYLLWSDITDKDGNPADGMLVIVAQATKDSKGMWTRPERPDEVAQASFDCDQVSERIQGFERLYGRKQKLSDSVSAVTDRLDKLDGMLEMWEAMKEGKWEREGAARGAPTIGIHIEAIANIMGYQVSDVQKLWRNYSEEQREEIKGNPQVEEEIARLKALKEKGVAGDLDSLLAS